MAGSNNTSLNDLLPAITAEAMFIASERSIMRGLVKNYALAAGQGNTITVPKYPAVTASAYTTSADTEIANSVVSTDGVTLTVSTIAVRTMVTDLVRASAASNVVADIGRLFGEAIARKLDQDLLALFAGFSVGVGTNSTALSAATVANAIARLRAASVPGDALACVVHPFVAFDLKSALTNTFANPASGVIQNEAMSTGYVGSLFGVPIFESANIVDTDGDSVGAVFHRDALGVAMIGDLSIETQRRASFLGDDIVASMHYGVGALTNSYGVKITADSSIVNPA